MNIQKISWAIVAVLAGCGTPQPAPQGSPSGEPTTGAPTTGAPTPGRKSLTQDECAAQGGSVVGDIGDGATHRPDYVCANGKPPLGNIAPPTGGPVAIEGSVCCPK
jgi:hypothetical protein